MSVRKVVPLRAEQDTEDQIALAFERDNGDSYLFNATRGSWYYFDGARWAADETGMVAEAIRQHCRKTGSAKFGRNSVVRGVARFCETSGTFARSQRAFDRDPLLLATPSGTVDIGNGGTLRPANPRDLITRMTTVPPSTAQPRRWLAFLAEATGDDDAMIRYLQLVAGYALTGSTREHAVFFIYGDGGTGKSTFINTLKHVAGSYAKAAPMSTFASANFDAHPTEIASLAGARLVVANETEQGKRWNASRIKTLSGGDPISARFMRQDFFEFTPEFKLIFVGNFAPSFESVDEAMRRRFYVIPFDRRPQKRDDRLSGALLAEAPAILNWAIEGTVAWQTSGLVIPEKVRAATDAYFAEQDLFGQWLDERVDRTDHKLTTRKSAALASWNSFRAAAGDPPETAKELAERLRRQGFKEGRSPDPETRSRIWFGMELRHDPHST